MRGPCDDVTTVLKSTSIYLRAVWFFCSGIKRTSAGGGIIVVAGLMETPSMREMEINNEMRNEMKK